MHKTKPHDTTFLKNILITILILSLSVSISFLLKNVFGIPDQISDVFLFAVFLVSALTKGYVYGMLAAFVGALSVHYAFTVPYYIFDISAPQTFFALVFMMIISVMTSALTTKLKEWEALKAENELERMRANLLRSVSHDLRTPLTTIYGSSSAILDHYDTFTDSQKKNIITGIKEDAEWLTRIVENLLSITRIDDIGKVKLIKTPTVLEELIDSVILKFKKRYANKPVLLDLPEEMVLIPMDAILIEQVLINLLENAVQHAKGMTTLSLKVFVLGKHAVFEISDDGCGIDKEQINKILSGNYVPKIQQLESKKRNAGIGLSVCAAVIKVHGGVISADHAKTGGAVFRFALPMEVDTIEQ